MSVEEKTPDAKSAPHLADQASGEQEDQVVDEFVAFLTKNQQPHKAHNTQQQDNTNRELPHTNGHLTNGSHHVEAEGPREGVVEKSSEPEANHHDEVLEGLSGVDKSLIVVTTQDSEARGVEEPELGQHMGGTDNPLIVIPIQQNETAGESQQNGHSHAESKGKSEGHESESSAHHREEGHEEGGEMLQHSAQHPSTESDHNDAKDEKQQQKVEKLHDSGDHHPPTNDTEKDQHQLPRSHEERHLDEIRSSEPSKEGSLHEKSAENPPESEVDKVHRDDSAEKSIEEASTGKTSDHVRESEEGREEHRADQPKEEQPAHSDDKQHKHSASESVAEHSETNTSHTDSEQSVHKIESTDTTEFKTSPDQHNSTSQEPMVEDQPEHHEHSASHQHHDETKMSSEQIATLEGQSAAEIERIADQEMLIEEIKTELVGEAPVDREPVVEESSVAPEAIDSSLNTAHEADESLSTAHEADESLSTAHEADESLSTAHEPDEPLNTAHDDAVVSESPVSAENDTAKHEEPVEAPRSATDENLASHAQTSPEPTVDEPEAVDESLKTVHDESVASESPLATENDAVKHEESADVPTIEENSAQAFAEPLNKPPAETVDESLKTAHGESFVLERSLAAGNDTVKHEEPAVVPKTEEKSPAYEQASTQVQHEIVNKPGPSGDGNERVTINTEANIEHKAESSSVDSSHKTKGGEGLVKRVRRNLCAII